MNVSLIKPDQIEGLDKMHDICTYQIKVRGQVDETAFNATSPLQVAVTRAEPTATLFTTHTDQSGLIGLIRHLHGHGFVLLSVTREE
jgi:hypothetical protein